MVDLKRIHVPRTYELVAAEIRRLILENVFPAGSVLPSEKELREQLGVGRSTVREALKVLEAWGLVKTTGQRGRFQVQCSPLEGLSHSLELAMEFGAISILEVTEVRRILEPHAAYRAAKRIGSGEAGDSEVSAIISACETNDSQDDFSKRNYWLHAAIAEASGNRLLAVLIQAMRNVIVRVDQEVITTDSLRAKMNLQHRELVARISRGEAEKAKRLMFEHISVAIEILLDRAATTCV